MTHEEAQSLADELNERAPDGVRYEVAASAERMELGDRPLVSPFYVRRGKG